MVNHILLEEKIKQSGEKVGYLAAACGMHINTFKKKRDGESDFTVPEVEVLSKELPLTDSECIDIFFA